MVLLSVDGDLVAVALGGTVRVYGNPTGELLAVLDHSPAAAPSAPQEGGETPSAAAGAAPATGVVIRDLDVNAATRHVAAVGDDKNVSVWDVSTPTKARILSQGFPKKLTSVRLVRARCTAAAAAAPSVCRVVVGDRQGMVHTVASSTKVPQTLFGHTASLITALAFSPQPTPGSSGGGGGGGGGDGLLLSGDRDEKVRASRFPETFDIAGFCLGHRKFVTDVATGAFPGPTAPPAAADSAAAAGAAAASGRDPAFVAVTGSGDGRVRAWRMPDCILLGATADGASKGARAAVASVSYAPATGIVAATMDDARAVFLHRLVVEGEGDIAATTASPATAAPGGCGGSGGAAAAATTTAQPELEPLVPLELPAAAPGQTPAGGGSVVAQFDAGGALFVVDALAARAASGSGDVLRVFLPVRGDAAADGDNAAGYVLRPAGAGTPLQKLAAAINQDLAGVAGTAEWGPSRVWHDPTTEPTLFAKQEITGREEVVRNLLERAAGGSGSGSGGGGGGDRKRAATDAAVAAAASGGGGGGGGGGAGASE